ncbi:hypothetical protein PQX77_015987 [Marasmius sp. AFHP31]|nr:hypothetical protein PQX77_015987 [Marasmius sp. AFHP31]
MSKTYTIQVESPIEEKVVTRQTHSAKVMVQSAASSTEEEDNVISQKPSTQSGKTKTVRRTTSVCKVDMSSDKEFKISSKSSVKTNDSRATKQVANPLSEEDNDAEVDVPAPKKSSKSMIDNKAEEDKGSDVGHVAHSEDKEGDTSFINNQVDECGEPIEFESDIDAGREPDVKNRAVSDLGSSPWGNLFSPPTVVGSGFKHVASSSQKKAVPSAAKQVKLMSTQYNTTLPSTVNEAGSSFKPSVQGDMYKAYYASPLVNNRPCFNTILMRSPPNPHIFDAETMISNLPGLEHTSFNQSVKFVQHGTLTQPGCVDPRLFVIEDNYLKIHSAMQAPVRSVAMFL